MLGTRITGFVSIFGTFSRSSCGPKTPERTQFGEKGLNGQVSADRTVSAEREAGREQERDCV